MKNIQGRGKKENLEKPTRIGVGKPSSLQRNKHPSQFAHKLTKTKTAVPSKAQTAMNVLKELKRSSCAFIASPTHRECLEKSRKPQGKCKMRKGK